MELLNNLSPPLLSIKGSTNTSLKWYCSCGKEGESEILLYTRCLVFINWCRLIGRYTFFVLSTTIKIRKSFSPLSFCHICYFRTSVWVNRFCWFYFPLTWHSCYLVTKNNNIKYFSIVFILNRLHGFVLKKNIIYSEIRYGFISFSPYLTTKCYFKARLV